MFKTKELKRFGSSSASLLLRLRRKAPEEDSPRLFLGQLQTELCEPVPNFRLEAVHVIPVLERRHKVIREPHQICFATAAWLDFLFKPEVQQEVKVDIAQDWRNHAPYTKGNFQFERVVTGWRGRSVLDLRLKK